MAEDGRARNFLPQQIFGYVSIKSGDTSVIQTEDLADVEAFHGTPENRDLTFKRIKRIGLEIIAESPLGFAVAGSKEQWKDFGEGPLKAFEQMLYTRAGRRQSVTHIGIDRQGPTGAGRIPDDFSGRIPDQAANRGLDLLAIERPRAAFELFPAPIPPAVDRFHLRVPDDVAQLLGATAAHRQGCRGGGVKVAMVDTGWSSHPFFSTRGYDVQPGLTAIPGSDPEYDPHGHGTGESANLFAVAPDATLLPIRAADDRGHLVATLAGFMLAKNSGAKVITCSWGGDYPYPDVPPLPSAADRVLELEIRDAIARNIVVVFSAGNGNFSMEAQVPGVISAGGVYADAGNQLWATPYASGYDSQWYRTDDGMVRVPTVCGLVGRPPRASYIMLPVPDGSRVDMERAAPGRDDPPDGTTPFDGWALFSGTSAAAPQIAGAAAVLLSINPQATPAQIRDALCASATDVRAGRCHPRFDHHAEEGPDPATGFGLINVVEAVSNWPAPAPGAQAETSSGADNGSGTEPPVPDRDKLIRLLELLATDEPFRAEFEKSPEAALRKARVDLTLDDIGIRKPVRLRPMVECQAALEDLQQGEPFSYVIPTRPLTSMHS